MENKTEKLNVNADNYACFDYSPFLERGREAERPEKTPYEVGDVVYDKTHNAIGVVLGCIDVIGEDLRLDTDGMTSFDDIRPATMEDFDIKEVRFLPRLKEELLTQEK